VLEFSEILVPTDFSAGSREAFARARSWLSGESPAVILLHVIDSAVVDLVSGFGFGTREEVAARMRSEAERQLEAMAAEAPGTEVVRLVVEGTPFYEIARHAEEFAVDAVVIAKAGRADPREALFFGSTAEKVIRACKQPVLVLTVEEPAVAL